MESTSNSFTGSYSYSIDNKGRVNIPAKMRKALAPANNKTFVVTKGNDRCIMVYPLQVWSEIEKKLIELNKGRALNRHFARTQIRNAEFVTYDSQGRIPLPNALVEYGKLEKAVEIVGMIDRIEIWNPDLLVKLEEDLDAYQEELEAIASEVRL